LSNGRTRKTEVEASDRWYFHQRRQTGPSNVEWQLSPRVSVEGSYDNVNDISSSQLQLYAAQNRAAPTESEARLWSALSGGKLGVAFRRQVVLGNGFIVDFVAPRVRLVVEVDGSYHAQRVAAEARRDSKLGRLGYRVLRIPAALVMRDLQAAVALVRAAL
jgi:very-short-patch-repair endonuclease